MKQHRHVGTSLTAGAFFLIGTLAVAQAPQRSRATSPHGTTANQPAGMAVDHAGGNGVRRMAGDPARSGNNPMYEGNSAAAAKPGSDGAQPQASNATKEPHATEVITPVYESFGMSRRKSANEGKGQANIKPGAGVSAAPYKDPEDMTTRYRPGNNKTLGAPSTPSKANAADRPSPIKSIEHPVGEGRASDKSLGSAHATESISPSNSAKKGDNPLYEDSGKSGTNPMYESGKQAAAKPNTKGTDVVEYKDGEDMQMRVNGNSKPASHDLGPDVYARKHIAGVKYEDRTAGNNSNANGNNAQGMAVNEQGSSKAPNNGQKHHR